MYSRVGKTGSLKPWSRVIVYSSKLSFCQNDPPLAGGLGGLWPTRFSPNWGSFWQKDSFLQYTMTQLQGPKDPVLPILMYIER